MQPEDLTSVLLIQAVEETDRAALIPPADRATATREATREPKGSDCGRRSSQRALSAEGQRLWYGALRRCAANSPRFPFVDRVRLAGTRLDRLVAATLALAFGHSALTEPAHQHPGLSAAR
jgi:hypothetical protein